jgi:hypothetical protein
MLTKDYYRVWQNLWNKLVPEYGQSLSVQGELVRAIGRMTNEFTVNGYCNWDEGYEIICSFLEEHLTDGTFVQHENEDIRGDVEVIRKYARRKNLQKGVDVGECHDRLVVKVIQWCQKHPTLIPRMINPNLKR